MLPVRREEDLVLEEEDFSCPERVELLVVFEVEELVVLDPDDPVLLDDPVVLDEVPVVFLDVVLLELCCREDSFGSPRRW